MSKKIILLLTLFFTVFSFSQCFEYIVSGGGHIVGKKTDNTLWGWGYGATNGQLCNTLQNTTTQIQLCNANDWKDVFLGTYTTYGIKNNGTLWSTGYNGWDGTTATGLLGINSSITNVTSFTQIGTATNWVKISSCAEFTLGLRSNGSMWAWGLNNQAQMGNGGTGPNVLAPQQIGTATDWANIEAIDIGTGIAIKTNGTLWAWGFSSTGLTGAASNATITTPIQVGTASDWLGAQLDGGIAHVIALKANGTLWSWGSGGSGQTGDGLSISLFRNIPRQIGTDTWKAIGAGFRSSYGIKTNGTLWAWGENQNGILGNGNTVTQFLPVQIGTATDWASVHTTSVGGVQSTIAVKNDGAVWAWGNNSEGQLGNGTYVNQLLPVLISGICAVPLSNSTFELEKNGVTLYPNPTNDLIHIQATITINSIEIYDVQGRTIQTIVVNQEKVAIDITNYITGIYFFKINTKNGEKIEKVIKD